jgi:hypothetical protein
MTRDQIKAERLYCCGCACDVDARLIDGGEAYPHRPDLRDLPFWKCDTCGNFVGCHHKTKNRTRPLGCIPTREIIEARKHIHALLDPLWQSGTMNRRQAYKAISDEIGKEYHTAEIRSVDEARSVYRIVQKIAKAQP